MRHWGKVFSMHLFRLILNARFLRYATLAFTAFLSVFIQLDQYGDLRNTNTDIPISFKTTVFADFPPEEVDATADCWVNGNCADFNQMKTKDVDTTLISVLNTLVALISLIYVPFSMLSSWLLSPDWTFGDFIHLRPVLHSLWVFVSNTVYVVFAVMLIVVAIANIFGQSDSYAIKKMLPRFIIGVIMVPFTWWVVSASLSVSSYLTALTLRMPADIMNANSEINTRVQIPTKCTLDFTSKNASKKIWECEDPPPEGVDLAKHLLQSDGAYGIIPLYAYNIFKFNKLDEFKSILSSDATKTEAFNAMSEAEQAKYSAGDATTKSAMLQAAIIATGIGKIGIQFIMSILFAIVFTVILIALVLVLFTRVIKMWMYAIFSPLFALRYFLSDKIDKDNALAKFDFKEFIGLAMVPVVVSAALGFGFMFIMTFKTQMEQPIEK